MATVKAEQVCITAFAASSAVMIAAPPALRAALRTITLPG
jgi:hypothetical protein